MFYKNITPAVTVIVPIYNVSDYIEKCARNVFEQTLNNLEILFIDDCSPDNSVQIITDLLEEYPERKSLTRIIKMSVNSGSAGVRRKGIMEATGEYIIHLDGDDWVDTDYYESLYKAAIQTNADIVMGDEVMEYPDKVIPITNYTLPSSGRDIIREWYKNTIGLFCHNKLVKQSIYRENNILPWEGLNMWEDNGLFARLFYYARKVVHVHGPAYHYNRCNVGAMTAGYGIKQVNQMIGIAKNLTDFFKTKPDAKDFDKTVMAFQYLAKLNLITYSFDNYRRFREIFPNSNDITSELDPRAFSSKGRIRFNMVRLGLAPAFILLFKIKKLLSK